MLFAFHPITFVLVLNWIFYKCSISMTFSIYEFAPVMLVYIQVMSAISMKFVILPATVVVFIIFLPDSLTITLLANPFALVPAAIDIIISLHALLAWIKIGCIIIRLILRLRARGICGCLHFVFLLFWTCFGYRIHRLFRLRLFLFLLLKVGTLVLISLSVIPCCPVLLLLAPLWKSFILFFVFIRVRSSCFTLFIILIDYLYFAWCIFHQVSVLCCSQSKVLNWVHCSI